MNFRSDNPFSLEFIDFRFVISKRLEASNILSPASGPGTMGTASDSQMTGMSLLVQCWEAFPVFLGTIVLTANKYARYPIITAMNCPENAE